MFCHGLMGFDTVTLGPAIAPLQIQHWRGIRNALEMNGTEVRILHALVVVIPPSQQTDDICWHTIRFLRRACRLLVRPLIVQRSCAERLRRNILDVRCISLVCAVTAVDVGVLMRTVG